MKPRKTWGGWFVAITTGWVQVCCALVFTCVGPAGQTLLQADREIERAVSSGRKDKEIFPSFYLVCKKRRSEFLCL